MFDTMGVVKLGIFYGEDLAHSSWWSILDENLSVYGRMNLVVDMDTYAKRSMRPKNLDMPFPFLSLSWIILLHLSHEIRRLSYYSIRLEDCEGALCYYPFGEARVDTSRLIPVGFFALLECLNRCFRPS